MINSYLIYRRSIELLKDDIDIIATEQTDLDKYTDKPNFNEKYAERRQKIIDRRLQINEHLEQLVSALHQYGADEYARGLSAGKQQTERSKRDEPSPLDIEALRAWSIQEAQNKWDF